MSFIAMVAKMSEGLGRTCAIFFLTLLFSLPLGLLVALMRMSTTRSSAASPAPASPYFAAHR